ncbi:DNA-binding transcriptional ArsR family regulator [Rhizobium binae]|uniref:DNA-binding transcriptional ArsR family regulator n=1 Tax=Rhizobium binae TaxID=1138190 RepID=A0ABV2MMF0_9HYPH|nr:metalloregulator ArsR/SmtB family transcription factor [Rhizobium binae]MBX4994520.1 winged helix-turn-helix transcriptional regulator [Rhizobium binae]NKL50394.1 metalloregulator ArsR/SmtB family transcription factor [Rhizobium leguminosarum bv. viciae]QSY84842.1 winged helix-turn-helix transcriptional regulator [Rhizobium binae]
MGTYSHSLPTLFGALSDPTRLAVVERLASGAASVSELSKPFEMARPSFLKHLRVLEDAGVVTSVKRGRVRTVSLRQEALGLIEEWVDWHRRRAEARLDRLGVFLQSEREDDE